jgi:hypothetical protein
MLESGSSGSVRGVLSNEHPYREPRSKGEILAKSKCFPLCPQQQTWGDCGSMSVSCQERKSY